MRASFRASFCADLKHLDNSFLYPSRANATPLQYKGSCTACLHGSVLSRMIVSIPEVFQNRRSSLQPTRSRLTPGVRLLGRPRKGPGRWSGLGSTRVCRQDSCCPTDPRVKSIHTAFSVCTSRGTLYSPFVSRLPGAAPLQVPSI